MHRYWVAELDLVKLRRQGYGARVGAVGTRIFPRSKSRSRVNVLFGAVAGADPVYIENPDSAPEPGKIVQAARIWDGSGAAEAGSFFPELGQSRIRLEILPGVRSGVVAGLLTRSWSLSRNPRNLPALLPCA